VSDAIQTALVIGASSFLGATMGALLLYFSTRRKVGLDDLQARYDQMQEDVVNERSARVAEVTRIEGIRRSESNQFRSEITGLRIEMVGLRVEVRVRDDYIGQLRHHIEDRKPPPAPPWPLALAGGAHGEGH
jgi:hypothetical protein